MKDDKVKLLILCSWKQFSITSPYMTYQKKSYFPIYGLFIREVKMFSALSFSKLFILGSLMTRNLFKAGPFHVPTHYWVNPGYTTLPARTVYQVLHIRLTNWKMEVMKKNAKRSLLSVIFNPLGKKKKKFNIFKHLSSFTLIFACNIQRRERSTKMLQKTFKKEKLPKTQDLTWIILKREA